MDGEAWLTVEQVADRLQVHQDTVRRWLRSGRLRGYLISRKAGYRIRPEDVDRFVMGGTPDDADQPAGADRPGSDR
ncbi:MAG: helix-turn-helix domain-containing protein [Chloroflexota bacterium]|nr:helix-turn-helix domain-containing protein [Chloroflexota bacterium]